MIPPRRLEIDAPLIPVKENSIMYIFSSVPCDYIFALNSQNTPFEHLILACLSDTVLDKSYFL